MGQRMRAADAVWFLGENAANPMMISAVLWFDGPVDLGVLQQRLEERVLDRHPVFRQRVVPSANPLLLPRWEDDPGFDLDRHVEVIDLPEPGAHADLERRCGEQRSTPLPRDRALWQLHVFRGYRGDGTAIHARIHHSVGDGIALMTLLLTLADEFEPGAIALSDDPDEGHPLAHAVHVAEDAAATGRRLVVHPTEAARALRRALVHGAWGARLIVPELAERSPLIGHPGGEKRMAWDPDGFDLDEVKRAGRAAEATVNDVLLGLLTGALHRYLEQHEHLVDDVLVMVPVNLRSPDDPLPRHLGNRIGLLPIRLPVGLRDREERLAVIRDRTRAMKNSPAPSVSRAVLASTALVTPTVERGIHRANQIRSTGVVTNVPGPRVPLHVGGARILGSVGWGGLTGHLNLSGSFISLGGRVFAGVVTDAAITPDPGEILRLLQREWQVVSESLAAH